MSCDIRSILRLLLLVSISLAVFSFAPTKAHCFALLQDQSSGEQLAEQVEEETATPALAEQGKPAAQEKVVIKEADGTATKQEVPEEIELEEMVTELEEIVDEKPDSESDSESDSDVPLLEGSTDEAGVILADGGGEKVLTPNNLRWIWSLVFLFLALCFLGWLLALITRKPEEPSVGSNLDSDVSNETSGTGTRAKDLDFGKVYATRPSVVDDLTKIGGIDAAAERRLNEAGIWQYDQLRTMTAQQRANLQRKLNLPRIRWYSLSGLGGGSAGTAAASTATAATATAALASSKRDQSSRSDISATTASSASRVETGVDGSTQRVDSELGKVYVRPPKFRDDLTRLQGVDVKAAKEMNAAGIYSFKQLQSLSPAQERAFEKRFGVSFAKMNVAGFATTSAKTGQGGSSSTTGPVSGGISTGASGATSGGSASGGTTSGTYSSNTKVSGFAATGGTSTNGNGIGKAAASVAGAAAAGAAGVAGVAASAASRAGKTASATASASVSVADLVSQGKGRMDDNFGFIYTSAPADADDLTKLVGIDADAAKRLNAAGIYKFDQLSKLDEQQTSALARRFKLPDADFSDWRRCFYAWGRGIATTAEGDEVYGTGMLHGIELPQIADGVFDGEKLVAYPEQVIFRGSNPEGWGRGNVDGIEGVETSMSCDAIRSNMNYVRIRRADTRESVVVPMTKGNIFSNGGENENGWNGSSEVFFGGRHIGVFAQHLPQEVETKFSQGGWGFGHRYDHNDRQEWGWGGRVIEPTTFEISVGCIGDVPGTVVFRSSDPSIWNTKTREGETHFADPVSSVSHPVNFVRIMRDATGEAVIVRVDGKHILDEGFDPRCGWNGSGSEFSGGMHLGAYHSHLPQDFETRFEFGGWGFGHPYDDNDRQAWGWAGRQLPETVFEITLLESVPDFMSHEVVE